MSPVDKKERKKGFLVSTLDLKTSFSTAFLPADYTVECYLYYIIHDVGGGK